MHLRRITPADRDAVLAVEAASTPTLRYLPDVFEMFVDDRRGEFFLAEADGRALGCAKFSVLPDGSGWLETLRVVPDAQGRGIGKALYARYLEIAARERTPALRMYTGLSNVVSKGLAELNGFTLEQTFVSASAPAMAGDGDFTPVSDPARATQLLMPHAAAWQGFGVLNRTFYPLNPAQCAGFAHAGWVFEHAPSGSVIVAGARFQPRLALHVALFGGDAARGLAFARALAAARGVPQVLCMRPQAMAGDALHAAGFVDAAAPFVVMRRAIHTSASCTDAVAERSHRNNL